jgi:hypothetical protein
MPILEIAKEAAELSDRLNNRLTGIALKADLLAAQSEGALREALLAIVEWSMQAAQDTRALREIADPYCRRPVESQNIFDNDVSIAS